MEIEECVFLILETVKQHYDERLFDIYNLNNLFAENKISFTGYKEEIEKTSIKEVDVDKVKKDTKKALNKFIDSIKKRGE